MGKFDIVTKLLWVKGCGRTVYIKVDWCEMSYNQQLDQGYITSTFCLICAWLHIHSEKKWSQNGASEVPPTYKISTHQCRWKKLSYVFIPKRKLYSLSGTYPFKLCSPGLTYKREPKRERTMYVWKYNLGFFTLHSHSKSTESKCKRLAAD